MSWESNPVSVFNTGQVQYKSVNHFTIRTTMLAMPLSFYYPCTTVSIVFINYTTWQFLASILHGLGTLFRTNLYSQYLPWSVLLISGRQIFSPYRPGKQGTFYLKCFSNMKGAPSKLYSIGAFVYKCTYTNNSLLQSTISINFEKFHTTIKI